MRRFVLKPRTDLYMFIFGGRKSQTDDLENAELVLYRSKRVQGKTYLFHTPRTDALVIGGYMHVDVPSQYALNT